MNYNDSKLHYEYITPRDQREKYYEDETIVFDMNFIAKSHVDYSSMRFAWSFKMYEEGQTVCLGKYVYSNQIIKDLTLQNENNHTLLQFDDYHHSAMLVHHLFSKDRYTDQYFGDVGEFNEDTNLDQRRIMEKIKLTVNNEELICHKNFLVKIKLNDIMKSFMSLDSTYTSMTTLRAHHGAKFVFYVCNPILILKTYNEGNSDGLSFDTFGMRYLNVSSRAVGTKQTLTIDLPVEKCFFCYAFIRPNDYEIDSEYKCPLTYTSYAEKVCMMTKMPKEITLKYMDDTNDIIKVVSLKDLTPFYQNMSDAYPTNDDRYLIDEYFEETAYTFKKAFGTDLRKKLLKPLPRKEYFIVPRLFEHFVGFSITSETMIKRVIAEFKMRDATDPEAKITETVYTPTYRIIGSPSTLNGNLLKDTLYVFHTFKIKL
jgi:hypothetical protein